MKKLLALALAAVTLFSGSLALAKTIEPEDTEFEHLAGAVVHATVGEYDADAKTFTVTLYEHDCFDIDDAGKLAAGDTLLADGRVYKVKEKTEDESGDITVVTEDGYEIILYQSGENMAAQYIEDDRRLMHAFAMLHLPVAEGILYEDQSDPDKEEPVVTAGLENILKIKAEKEENSIGFDFYATIIELNDNLEIVRIHQDFDVAQ